MVKSEILDPTESLVLTEASVSDIRTESCAHHLEPTAEDPDWQADHETPLHQPAHGCWTGTELTVALQKLTNNVVKLKCLRCSVLHSQAKLVWKGRSISVNVWQTGRVHSQGRGARSAYTETSRTPNADPEELNFWLRFFGSLWPYPSRPLAGPGLVVFLEFLVTHIRPLARGCFTFLTVLASGIL